jgi:maleylacetoacetate isomerase
MAATEGEGRMKLYTYYRSQASFRVRIALNLKGIAREDSFLHLEKGDQFDAAYRAINPQMVVPTLIDGDVKLFQSLAILEYLDEAYPEPPLLSADPQARAWVRRLALINVAGSHPLIVPFATAAGLCSATSLIAATAALLWPLRSHPGRQIRELA